MIPNFEPQQILPKLTELLRPKDYLLFGANLAPGKNYAAGMKKILPQYDNPLTRDWLTAFLFDLGVEPRDGRLFFSIETGGLGLRRVVAKYSFSTRAANQGGRAKTFLRARRNHPAFLFLSPYARARPQTA